MIRLEHLRKEYELACPLKDVNVTINKGDVVCIIGPSGTGKSTLLRMVNLLEKPTSGKIFFNDEEITAKNYKPSEARKKMAMVFQSFNLFNHLSVIENLMAPQIDLLNRTKDEAYKIAMEKLDSVGLKRQCLKYPSGLSGGQKQRVAIARALVMEPEIILFDEPTSALDPLMVNEIVTIMKELASKGQTMMIVTHDMELAETVGNRIFYMDQGGIYEDDTPEVIFHNPKRTRTKAFIESLNVLKLSVHNDFNNESLYEQLEKYIISTKMDEDLANKLRVIYDELIVELLIDKNKCNNIRLLVSYNEKNKSFTATCLYDGKPLNVIENKSVQSTLINNAVHNIKYKKTKEEEYTNSLSFES